MLDTTNRRDFLKASALFGAGSILFGRMPAWAANGASGGVIGDLTALALADDALHLARAGRNLAPPLKESLAFGIDVFEPLPGNAAFFGRLLPAASGDIVTLIGGARDGWAGRGDDDHIELTLALSSGWLIQRAGMQIIGPSLEGAADLAEATAHQDAAVLRARSSHLAANASQAEVASLFLETVPRTMTRFHTLVPDYDDAEGWIIRLQRWRPEHAAALERYARAFVDTASPAHRRYVVDADFYDADDDVVRLAAQARKSETPAEVDLQRAVDGTNDSLYGKALARGMSDLLAVSAHLQGALDAGDFQAHIAKA